MSISNEDLIRLRVDATAMKARTDVSYVVPPDLIIALLDRLAEAERLPFKAATIRDDREDASIFAHHARGMGRISITSEPSPRDIRLIADALVVVLERLDSRALYPDGGEFPDFTKALRERDLARQGEARACADRDNARRARDEALSENMIWNREHLAFNAVFVKAAKVFPEMPSFVNNAEGRIEALEWLFRRGVGGKVLRERIEGVIGEVAP